MFFLVGLNWIEFVIFVLRALVMIEIFFKVVSILALTSPSDYYFYKVWIIFRDILTNAPIVLRELKRRFEVYVVKIDWIIIIKFCFYRERCDCGVLSLLQVDEFQ